MIDELERIFAVAATKDYIGEAVSQLEHALQCAALAREAGADDVAIAAALLHDVGHLCAPPDAPQMDGFGVAAHEHIGARYVTALGLDPRVGELIAAHVDAKRYLVATNAQYAARLSPASRETLRRQGGPMSAVEVSAFAADPACKDKLRLRVWDEEAKRVNWHVPAFATYHALLKGLAAR